jgi:hypothetical protein
MRKLILALVAAVLAVIAAVATFKHVASAPAATKTDPRDATLLAAGVDPATVQNGTTAAGETVFTARRSDGATCAGFGQAVICPKTGKTNLFADGPVVTISVSKLLGQNKDGSVALGPTQRLIGFVRNDVASVTLTLPSGTTTQLPVKDHAFAYPGSVESITALDRSGNKLGSTSTTSGSES